jgi:putative DNA primase/helicase
VAKKTFAEQFERYVKNVYPAMLAELAEDYGVSTEALSAIGIGFNPNHQSWVSPERNESGEIIGLVERFPSKKKRMVKGSKRGLAYKLNPDYEVGDRKYEPGKHNWTPAKGDINCPVCGKNDWCLVSADDPQNPSAVICGRTSVGARRYIEDSGYLHILQDSGQVSSCDRSAIISSERPVLIVEGFSDVVAAIDLDFEAVGRPSATSVTAALLEITRGRDVVIIGENDAGAGELGMEKTFHALQSNCRDAKKVLPPKGFKDLRDWTRRGELTAELFLKYIEEYGEDTISTDILEDDSSSTLASVFLDERYSYRKVYTLRNHKGQWMFFKTGRYVKADPDTLRGQIYSQLKGKSFKKVGANGAISYAPVRLTRAKVTDVIDACNQWCTVTGEPPQWLDGKQHLEPSNCIVCRNGIIDLGRYFRGDQTILEPDPRYFCLNALPHDFDSTLIAEEIIQYFNEIFNNQQDCLRLLQEWFGYHLTLDMSFEKMMILRGPPRSGKGTILGILMAMLGDDQVVSTELSALTTDFGYSPLVGKSAAFLPDAKVGWKRNIGAATEKLLQVIGGDPVGVNAKFKSIRSAVRLTCKFTMAVNIIPEIPDGARALESRLNILSFPNSYVGKEDWGLKRRLARSAHKLIPWALQGLKRLRERGEFTFPESSESELETFRVTANAMSQFVEECCIVSGADRDVILCQNIFELWDGWCKANGRTRTSHPHFGQLLKMNCPGVRRARLRVEGERTYVYAGLRVTEAAKKLYL